MKRYLLLVLLIGFWSCEDNEEENYIVHDLPQEFPLNKDYAWEYERISFSTKTLWELELQPDDTTYLDTLYVVQTENDYSYYWWGNNPNSFNLVKNQDDVNHFIRIGRYYIENDTIAFYDKPSLWVNYDSNFDTTGYSDIYDSFLHNRTTAIDTIGDTITHSYLQSTNSFYDEYEYFLEKESNLFGTESWKYYYDYLNDDQDWFAISKKQREINVAPTSMALIRSKFDNQLNQINNLYNNSRMPQRYSDDRIHDHGIW